MHLLVDTAPSSPTFPKEGQKPIILSPLDGSLVLKRLDHASNDNDSATRRRRPRRQVCFDEGANLTRVFDPVTEEEYDDVWYHGGAVEYFRHERRLLVAAIHRADVDRRWSQALFGVYCAFRQMENPDDVANVLGSTRLDMDEFTVGLEKYIVPPVAYDFPLRRQHLLTQFHHLQQYCIFDSAEHREQLLRDTSRLSSRASRMFAQYCAQVAAACGDADKED